MITANHGNNNTTGALSTTHANQRSSPQSGCLNLPPSIAHSETFDEEDDVPLKMSSLACSEYQSNRPAPQALLPRHPLTHKLTVQRSATRNEPLPLLSLPIDTLHKISTFLEVGDWCSVSLVNRAAHLVCSDVFRRIRIHGFQCAAEIITAWEAGQHADAKELAALYIQSGVPIYPARRRDVYHTILQRMKAETTEMTQPTATDLNEDDNNVVNNNRTDTTNQTNSNTTSTNSTNVDQNAVQSDNTDEDSSKLNDRKQVVDRFYLERKDARDTGGYYLSTLTYLEEKSLFWREDRRTDGATGGGGGSNNRGVHQQRNNNNQHYNDDHRNGVDENLHHHLHRYYPAEDFELFHDYNMHQLRTFGDPELAVVAAFDAVEPFRPQPVRAGGQEGQGRYYRNPNLNQYERHPRMPGLPPPRRGVDTGSSMNSIASPLLSPTSSETELNRRRNKIEVHCHKHLVDRHYLGRPAVHDGDGGLCAATVNLGADFFHWGASGRGANGSPLFGFGGMPGREGMSKRNNATRVVDTTGTGGAVGTGGIARPDTWQQIQSQIPQRSAIYTGANIVVEEEEQHNDQISPNTEHSEDTLFHTPSSSPTPGIGMELDGRITPTPSSEPFGDYPAAPGELAATGLTPPPIHHSNLTPNLSPSSPSELLEVPLLEPPPHRGGRSSPTAQPTAQPMSYDNTLMNGSQGEEAFSRATFPYVVELNVMNDVVLHSYSSTLGSYEAFDEQKQRSAGVEGSRQTIARRKKVRDRIRHYDAKLKSHLDKPPNCRICMPNSKSGKNLQNKMTYADHASFDECLLDFWDEFFSLTANIHYFDTHSPIPRATKMWEFLSQPCSKALGTIQCEIERMRTVKNPNGKKNRGAKGVKEKLFPTYEYRLFLRDRRCVQRQQQHGQAGGQGRDARHNHQHQYPPQPPNADVSSGADQDQDQDQQHPVVRLDTILMSAKYRGKKYGTPVSSSGGQRSSSNQSKKGVNNYYLYMPQKPDIEHHFKTVNATSVSIQDYEQFAQKPPSCNGKELGRVQSNFIGTEFQIFSPKNGNKCAHRNGHVKTSSFCGNGAMNSACESSCIPDNGTSVLSGYNRCSSENMTGRNSIDPGRKSTRGLRSLRKSMSRRKQKGGGANHWESPEEDERDNATGLPPFARFKRSWLRSRRVIANSEAELSDNASSQIPMTPEVEIGAITYTANLLGNRPRIMDVCIPKVHSNEWRNYCESSDDSPWTEVGPIGTIEEEEKSMLNKLKRLQMAAEQQLMQDHNQMGEMVDLDIENSAEELNSTADFGLLSLQNRPPWWNVELGAFVLNFGGRVSVASVKNFQLCDRHNHDDSMLQFGRIEGRHSFTMDYAHPLSAVQAFAIAISSLQSKISFG